MKIAILGTENSHAAAFARLIRDDAAFAGLTVIGAYGYDGEANRRLEEEGLVTRFGATPDAFAEEADGILVTARHGDLHLDYALPYLTKGIPAFIDKPITVATEKTDILFETAQKYHAPVCGGSSLKFLKDLEPLARFREGKKTVGGNVSAPVSMVNNYAGFYFYAQHLIEMMFRVFGTAVRHVGAYCPDPKKNRISMIFDYGDYDVTAQYYDSYEYTCAVHTSEGSAMMHTKDLGDCYRQELLEFKKMAQTRIQPHSFVELKRPGILMHRIEEARITGKMVDVGFDIETVK